MFKVKYKYSTLADVDVPDTDVYDVTYTEEGRPIFLVHNVSGWMTVDGDAFEPVTKRNTILERTWTCINDDPYVVWRCDNCKRELTRSVPYNYCPFCGSHNPTCIDNR